MADEDFDQIAKQYRSDVRQERAFKIVALVMVSAILAVLASGVLAVLVGVSIRLWRWALGS